MGKIFLWCVPLGTGGGYVNGSTRGGDVMGYALAEDGTGLASHLSSNEDFSKHDIGLTSNWHHEAYEEHYPDGFELEWVDDPENHELFNAAYELNKQKAQATAQPN